MTGQDLATVIVAHRFRYANEDELQRGLADAFDASGIAARREVTLDAASRVDFMVGRVAVEVKVDGQARNVERQLRRYALSDQVDELVLVTNRGRHLLPTTLEGKPVTVVSVSRPTL